MKVEAELPTDKGG